MTHDELKSIVEKLVVLGDDREELEYWMSIYDDLDDARRGELDVILKEELDKLSAILK